MTRRPGAALACATIAVLFGCSRDDAAAPPTGDAGADTGDGAPVVKATGLPQTCARGAKRADRPSACNGDSALCDRTFDKVTVPMAHNAMSNADDGWGVPNQSHGLARQLADGIRGMMLDLHYFSVEENRNLTEHDPTATTVDQIYLCHASCALGKQRLLDGLCTITKFLDENPGEVVSTVFETYVSDADTDEVLRASGLADYAYAHPKGAPWPTLRSMIDEGKRAVLFVEKGGGAPPYLMPAYEGNVWDTPYSFEKKEDFTCALGRGVAGSPIFLVNHWLGRPLADIAFAREVNVDAVLGARVAQCTKEAGRAPTFVAVDFYDVGDLFTVVRRTNGLAP
jgi:hypothetical protein